MSHHGSIGQYSDPWTRRKAQQAKAALLRSGAMGQADTADPPPPKKAPVGLMVGWAALLLVSAGMFYSVTSGKVGRPVRTNRRRSSRR